MKSLRDIYDDILSCAVQLGQCHDALMDLNTPPDAGWKFSTTETDEVMPLWALDEVDRIQGEIYALTSQLWDLPEVNRHSKEKNS